MNFVTTNVINSVVFVCLFFISVNVCEYFESQTPKMHLICVRIASMSTFICFHPDGEFNSLRYSMCVLAKFSTWINENGKYLLSWSGIYWKVSIPFRCISCVLYSYFSTGGNWRKIIYYIVWDYQLVKIHFECLKMKFYIEKSIDANFHVK